MDLLTLEQQRQALELNLQKLRQTLKLWQTWEAEYEGLKEEVLGVEGDVTSAELVWLSMTCTRTLADRTAGQDQYNLRWRARDRER